MIDLNEMAKQMYEVAQQREKNHPVTNSITGIELLKHLSTEVVEASMVYSVSTDAFRKELGDVLCIAMLLAYRDGFDIEDMLKETYEKNKARAEKHGDKL